MMKKAMGSARSRYRVQYRLSYVFHANRLRLLPFETAVTDASALLKCNPSVSVRQLFAGPPAYPGENIRPAAHMPDINTKADPAKQETGKES